MLPYLTMSCRLLLGLVFLVSAVTKLRTGATRREFVLSVRALLGYERALSVILATASVAAELVIVVLLTLPSTMAFGFVTAALLLVAYAVVLGRALKRGVRAPCQCIGSSTAPIRAWLIARNIGLVLVSLIGLAGIHSEPQIQVSTGLARASR